MTQENCRAPGYKQRQKRIKLGCKWIWIDRELIPLIKALNSVGLVTRSHCVGHTTGVSWIAIKRDNITGIDIKSDGIYNEVIIEWKNKKRKKRIR